MNQYTRQNPSPWYKELLTLYRQMHNEGVPEGNLSPDETFPGKSLNNHAARIGQIITVLGSETILDYGSGKGRQYGPVKIRGSDGTSFDSIQSFWRVKAITCYDPAYPPFSALPDGTFDGVVSTDVLEHCPKEDVPWIIEEIFSYAREFVFLNVACFPAKKTLPNGENAHCTIEPVEWWKGLLDDAVARRPGLRYYADFYHRRADGEGKDSLVNSFLSGKSRVR